MLQISLAAARVNAEMTQGEAAPLLDVTPKTLRGYERGYVPIPTTTLKRAARIYKIPEDAIRLPIVLDGCYDEEEKNLNHSTF